MRRSDHFDKTGDRSGRKTWIFTGDLQSNIIVNPRPLYDVLYQIMVAGASSENSEKGLIEVAPLAYMRGRIRQCFYHFR